jgi:hypothetical protein
MRVTVRVGMLAAVAVVGWACAGASLARDPPELGSLRRVVLVRAVDRHDRPHPKDPLDAVRESLEAEGRTTRTVEVGPHAKGEAAALGRLYAEIEGRIDGVAIDPERTRNVDRLARGTLTVLDDVGADGAVVLIRFGPRPLAPPAGALGAFARGPDPRALGRPAAALAVVDRDGTLLWFAWGGAEPLDRDPAAPSTAAEAVDALLRAVFGPGDAPDA